MMFLRSRIQREALFNNTVRILSIASCPQRGTSSQNNTNYNDGQKQTRRKLMPYIASLAAIGGAYYFYEFKKAQKNLPEFRHEHRRFDLPNYTLKEFHERRDEGRIWSIYGRGIYDLTDYAKIHPGGEETIAMASGVALESFFKQYSFHRNPEIFELLETMRVGNLVHSRKHYHHYRYGHHHHHHHEKQDRCKPPKVSPTVDLDNYRLELKLEGERLMKALRLEDLKLYPTHSIISSIPCKSNSKQKDVANIEEAGPTWTGARLCDILKDLAMDKDLSKYDELEFECLDADKSDNGSFTSSIKLSKVLLPPGEKTSPEVEVLLAYKRNGVELEPEHGFPVRVVIPELAGSKNVKWLGKIVLKKKIPSPESDKVK